MLHTTLNKIRACSPCESGWSKLMKHIGKTKADDEILPFEVILKSNGLDDALWCMRSAPEYEREWRLFAVWCARQVQHINTDPRVSAAIDAAEDYANGRINEAVLSAAGSAAWSAAESAARSAAWSAAWSAAESAAWSAADSAAWSAARSAAGSAAWSAAGSAARSAAGSAAWSAARSAQSEVFCWIVNGGLAKFEKGE